MCDNSEINSLIEKAKNNDQIAYKTLLNKYWKDIYRFQFSKSKNEDEAEDITIKTFARAFDKIDTYDKKFKFKTWLISISANLYIDHLRKQKTKTVSIHKDFSEAFNLIDEDPTPEDKIIYEQNLAKLKAYVKQLKPHYQEVINLRYFQELSYKEIAEQLGEPLNNIKVKLLRAKKLLYEIIKNIKPG